MRGLPQDLPRSTSTCPTDDRGSWLAASAVAPSVGSCLPARGRRPSSSASTCSPPRGCRPSSTPAPARPRAALSELLRCSPTRQPPTELHHRALAARPRVCRHPRSAMARYHPRSATSGAAVAVQALPRLVARWCAAAARSYAADAVRLGVRHRRRCSFGRPPPPSLTSAQTEVDGVVRFRRMGRTRI